VESWLEREIQSEMAGGCSKRYSPQQEKERKVPYGDLSS